jgi:hypothetical protein
MKTRICVVTAGHLATTPRMVKAADALADEGYDVTVVSTQFIEWADNADRSILASRWSRWRRSTVDYRKRGALPRYAWSALRMRAARQIVRALGAKRAGVGTAGRVRERVFPELVSAVIATRPTMIYGGGSALASTAMAARRTGVRFALDLEDFHSAQDASDTYVGVTEEIERRILPDAAMLTGGSRPIAEAYRAAYGVDVVPINNVFPLPQTEPTLRDWDGTLRLYWFGQTIGPGRGLEETIDAAGSAGIRCELAVRGNTSGDYVKSLLALAAERAPALTLTVHGPAAPDDMVDLCRVHDVGIAIENPARLNQDLALSNKSLTYILAGLAVAMNDTIGQRELALDLGEGALLCPRGDSDSLARGFRQWSENPERLARAKAAAWEGASRRWHWEHAEERGKLLAAIAGALQ